MINIENIYHDYLLEEGDKHKEKYTKFKGWYSASSAGSCHRKQWYKINGYEESPYEIRPLRVMRLGTLVHKDLEQAIIGYNNKHKIDDVTVYSEHRIELPNINVVGHLDLAVDTEDKLFVYDLKTAHSFKWKKVFGRNIDPNPSVNYQLQLGTYALGLLTELDKEKSDVEMGLIWYRKDDSMMKIQTIDKEWIQNAFYYWIELNESIDEEGKPEIGSYNTPVYNWECKYCNYYKIHCKGK
jgi:CRISPR/Cas system-associated exonuclease Cas4 (RecB family)